MSMSLESLMRESVLEPREATLGAELVSFLLIGAGAIAGFVLLSSLIASASFDLPGWAPRVISYAMVLICAYAAHRRFSFHSLVPHFKALPIYLGVQVGVLGLAVLFPALSTGTYGLPTLVAALVVIGLTSGVNFIVVKLLAFQNAPLTPSH